MKRSTMDGRGIVALVGIVIGLVMPTRGAWAQVPGVWAPNSQPYGKSYAQWTAEWWKWAFAIPASANPLLDSTGSHSRVGQSGPVWFLPGYGDADGTAFAPSATVPSTVAILLPIINAECSTVEAPPFYGANEQELRKCARDLINNVPKSSLAVTVDGVTLQSPASYRVASPLFSFTFPAKNVLFVPGPGEGQSISDGYWLFLAPLSVGEHTITLHGASPALGFVINTTWHLTVR